MAHQLPNRAKAMMSTLPQQQTNPVFEGPTLGPALLRARDLGLTFSGNRVFSGVNLDLREGECVLLAGENGAGKTSLINILAGNLAPTSGRIRYSANGRDRTFSFPSQWWNDLNPWNHFRPEFVARAGVGRSWQDIRLFGSLTLRDNLRVADTSGLAETPLAALGLATTSSDNSAVLANLGLGGREDSSADMISLGQSKRVAIARAIAAGARVLFLDEPLAGLDRDGIESVVKYLRRLIEEHQLTLVIVEHVFNQHHLLPLVTTRWELKDGRLTSQSADAVTSVRGADSRDDWIQALIAAGKEVVEQSLPRNALLTRIQIGDSEDRSPVLEVRDLAVSLGQRQVLGIGDHGESAPLSLTVNRGAVAILEAPNGWGKTTLFKVIAGDIQPSTGSWLVQGKEKPRFDLVNCVPSSGSLFPSLAVRDVAAVASKPLSPRFQPMARRSCSSLSGGERQRLALSLSSPKTLNVYDEPLNGLDDWHDFVDACTKQAHSHQAILILIPRR
jgi:branched-chain amino acid transport system ATP-binding protein